MSGLELNKIAAAVLVAGLTAMVVSKVTSALYHPDEAEERGYSIEVAEGGDTTTTKKPEGPVDITLFLADATVEKGESLIRPCATCHSFEQGGPHKVGPNLWGILGSNFAHHSDFSYSNAFMERSGEVWDFQNLSEFFTKPAKYIPGTKMAYAGMKKPEDRAALIVYLNSLGSNKPIPAPPPPEETEPEEEVEVIEEAVEELVEEIVPETAETE